MPEHKFSSPPSPPPAIEPTYCERTRDDHLPILKNCLNVYLYMWLKNGESFWLYPTWLTGEILHGYRWDRGTWKPIIIEHQQIDNFF